MSVGFRGLFWLDWIGLGRVGSSLIFLHPCDGRRKSKGGGKRGPL